MSATTTSQPASKEHRRSKTGCQTCRSKRKKCDEKKPRCDRCIKAGASCDWPAGISFRYEDPSEHFNVGPPAKRRDTGRSRSADAANTTSSDTQVVVDDVDDTVTSSANVETFSDQYRSPSGVPVLSTSTTSTFVAQSRNRHDMRSESYRASMRTSKTGSMLSPQRIGSRDNNDNNASMRSAPYQPQNLEHSTHTNATSSPLDRIPGVGEQRHTEPRTSLPFSPDAAPFHRDRANFGAEQTLPTPDIDLAFAMGCSPDVLTDDGIFLPGSTYQELHKTLRSQIFLTANSQPNSRRNSLFPPRVEQIGYFEAPYPDTIAYSESETVSSGSSTPPELTASQEAMLWSNWINEIAAWLDKFDHDQHFRHTLPALAQIVPHLKYSMLALSARQLERKDKHLPTATSLGLYQWAIHLLVPKLHTRDISTLASCVILCVFEMSSCSPKAWRRHLDGCASLIMALDIRGDHGGLEESLFWCFARMDVCGALIAIERPLIPVDRWISPTDPTSRDYPRFPIRHFEDHASHVCHLLARVVSLLNQSKPSTEGLRDQSNNSSGQTFVDQWIRLFDDLKSWQQNIPTEMKPVMSFAANPENISNPFNTLIYSNGAAVSGNQLFHTAMLLMLQRKPRGISTESRSILWHARQICAISMSNEHHGAWTNCIQPIWLAGQLMSHPSEHHAILELYSRIETKTGWGAVWRAADLRDYWGDLS